MKIQLCAEQWCKAEQFKVRAEPSCSLPAKESTGTVLMVWGVNSCISAGRVMYVPREQLGVMEEFPGTVRTV